MESIGGLEELILLIVLSNEKIHAVDIGAQYEASMERTITLPAIHAVLKRMEKKGWVDSRFGEPSPERGGKRKRYYWATNAGFRVISEAQQRKTGLWKNAIKPSLDFSTS